MFYTGVTNDLERRVREHKSGLVLGFTTKYKVNRLMYFAEFHDINEAIEWEKKVKDWRRERKIELIKSINPEMKDLGAILDFSADKSTSK